MNCRIKKKIIIIIFKIIVVATNKNQMKIKNNKIKKCTLAVREF